MTKAFFPNAFRRMSIMVFLAASMLLQFSLALNIN